MISQIDREMLQIAIAASKRSKCVRRQVGAVIFDGSRYVFGYNGAPTKLAHCTDVGCRRQQLNVPSGQNAELCRGSHAEQNVLIHCAKQNLNPIGTTLYCTNKPCSICAKMIINAQIKRIVYIEDYNDELSDELLKESKIEIEKCSI